MRRELSLRAISVPPQDTSTPTAVILLYPSAFHTRVCFPTSPSHLPQLQSTAKSMSNVEEKGANGDYITNPEVLSSFLSHPRHPHFLKPSAASSGGFAQRSGFFFLPKLLCCSLEPCPVPRDGCSCKWVRMKGSLYCVQVVEMAWVFKAFGNPS